MREIKFRAWDKVLQKFIQWDNSGSYDDGVSWGAMHGLPLMQYTGLKDKNGVEIYEGDVVDGNHGIGFMKFSRGIFDLYDIEEQENVLYWPECRSIRGVVIGNIYENPELLKD